MPFKLNKKAIQNYSHTLTEKIIYHTFSQKDYITGQEINTLTESAQINTLIFKTLFDRWNEEIEKFKSPYFDFDHKDVQEALGIFKNKLSFHIKVSKADFEPILEEAVKDTLSLAFEPIESVERIFLNDINNYKDQLKFLKIHPDLAKDLKDQEGASLEDLNRIVESWDRYEDNASTLLNQTGKFHAGDIHDFILDEPEATAADPEPVIKTVPLITEEQTKESLNDRFQNENEVNNLANQFQRNQKIQSLQAGININQRFVFMKELFGGEADNYNSTIERLDGAGSIESAESILKEEAYGKYDWENKEEIVEEFMTVLNRRFN